MLSLSIIILSLETSGMSRGSARKKSRAYHHGDLKAALLRETEAILERDGVQALSLREAARAIGVSHAAPANHFGDLTGLLSELAAIGFNRFSAALAAAKAAAGDDPAAMRSAMGRAYVGFARAHSELFALMFQSRRLDMTRPALIEAIGGARQALRGATFARATDAPASPLATAAHGVALWSLVHGFAVLLNDGRLEGTLNSMPGGEDADALLDAVLATTQVGA
jgi:AcrR family transcriptional regulator